MKLNVAIHKLKCIEDLQIDLPLEKGLYAITGQNGSGKSTIVTCASSAFYELIMKDYFGETPEDSSITITLNNRSCIYKKELNSGYNLERYHNQANRQSS